MRLTVRAPGREIDIELAQNTQAALKTVEGVVLRLLDALPAGQEDPGETPFGFSLATDTERTPDED